MELNDVPTLPDEVAKFALFARVNDKWRFEGVTESLTELAEWTGLVIADNGQGSAKAYLLHHPWEV